MKKWILDKKKQFNRKIELLKKNQNEMMVEMRVLRSPVTNPLENLTNRIDYREWKNRT